MSKVTKQGEPGLGPKSPDSLLKTIPYISCSATKHPFTHKCTHACTHSRTPTYLSHHKSIYSQRVSAPIGHSVLPCPCLAGHWNPLHSPLHQRSLFRVPLKSPCRSSPHFQPQSIYLQGGLRNNLSSLHFQARVEMAPWRTGLGPIAMLPPIIPPQTAVLAFAKSPWPS